MQWYRNLFQDGITTETVLCTLMLWLFFKLKCSTFWQVATDCIFTYFSHWRKWIVLGHVLLDFCCPWHGLIDSDLSPEHVVEWQLNTYFNDHAQNLQKADLWRPDIDMRINIHGWNFEKLLNCDSQQRKNKWRTEGHSCCLNVGAADMHKPSEHSWGIRKQNYLLKGGQYWKRIHDHRLHSL